MGEEPRYKARLVAKEFTQRQGIDFNEIFSPVVKHSSIRVILALTAHEDFELEQLDVKTAFLHGGLEEEIYMAQPEGYVQAGEEDKVCLLKRSLYGLKQSPRQWYKRFDAHMIKHGYIRSSYDTCVYYKEYKKGKFIYLLLYVDDMLIACKDKSEIEKTKDFLKKEFEMKELGDAKKILGMEITRNRSLKLLKLSQSGYTEKVLENYSMAQGKVVQTPIGQHFKLSASNSPQTDEEKQGMSNVPYASAVGSLMYLMVCTRPDIAYCVSIVSRYLANPGKEHWSAVKWILRYLKGIVDVGLVYGNYIGDDCNVIGYADADFAKDLD